MGPIDTYWIDYHKRKFLYYSVLFNLCVTEEIRKNFYVHRILKYRSCDLLYKKKNLPSKKWMNEFAFK